MPQKKVDLPPNQEIIPKENPRRKSVPASHLVTGIRNVVGRLGLKKVPVRLRTLGQITAEQREKLFTTLEARFNTESRHYRRPFEFDSADVIDVIDRAGEGYIYSLSQMEFTGGKPDIYGIDDNKIVFADFSHESPMGRRGQTYSNAVRSADGMGLQIMPKGTYFAIQERGIFDMNTLSWLATPPDARIGDKAFVARYDEETGNVIFDVADDNFGPLAGYVGWRAVLEVPRI
jgi:hypothetical protein